jgi:hypothetical protein
MTYQPALRTLTPPPPQKKAPPHTPAKYTSHRASWGIQPFSRFARRTVTGWAGEASYIRAEGRIPQNNLVNLPAIVLPGWVVVPHKMSRLASR